MLILVGCVRDCPQTVHVARHPSPGAQYGDCVAQHVERITSAIGGVGVREQRAKVIRARRAEQRIRNGMGHRIAVGVTLERVVVRNAHATESHGIARREAVGIVADTRAEGDAQAAALPGAMIE